MAKGQRHEEILRLLRQAGSVEVAQLCQLLGVAQMTIRRDLDELDAAGKLVRTHGGAALRTADVLLEKPFSVRVGECAPAKERIAQAAAGLLRDGDKIFLSSGSTAYYLARRLDNSRRLLVVTDGVSAALELSGRPNISTILVGGELRGNTLSTTGSIAEGMVRHFAFDAAYAGVTSVGKDGRLYHGSLVELGIYQAVLAASRRVVVLADAGKLGRDDFVCVGRLGQGTVLVSDAPANTPLLANYRSLGAEVVLA